jgi:Acetyltransferase (GNAT) domain
MATGTALLCAGIAGVGTDPKFRRQGLATVGMKRATEIPVEEGFDLGALFCAPKMVPFYERLGWRRYDGAVFIKQPGNNHMPWSGCMTLARKRDTLAASLMSRARHGDHSDRILKLISDDFHGCTYRKPKTAVDRLDVPALRPGTIGAYALAFVCAGGATVLRVAIDPYGGRSLRSFPLSLSRR